MRPFDSVSTFLAHGIKKSFGTDAAAGKKPCSRSVIGCCAEAVEDVRASDDSASIAPVTTAAKRVGDIMGSSQGFDACWPVYARMLEASTIREA